MLAASILQNPTLQGIGGVAMIAGCVKKGVGKITSGERRKMTHWSWSKSLTGQELKNWKYQAINPGMDFWLLQYVYKDANVLAWSFPLTNTLLCQPQKTGQNVYRKVCKNTYIFYLVTTHRRKTHLDNINLTTFKTLIMNTNNITVSGFWMSFTTSVSSHPGF